MLLNQFRGIAPRIPVRQARVGDAIRAHNVDLSNGTLRSWREVKHVARVQGGAKTVVSYGCCFFGFTKCVSTAPWIPDCPRLYITGNLAYPEVAVLNHKKCSYDSARLGVPTPVGVPLVNYVATGISDDATYRSYVFTYVNWLNEESAPSYPSDYVPVIDGTPVTVSGWEFQPGEWKVQKVRIYRSATGFRVGSEKEQVPLTGYLLVDEIPITQASYIDKIKDLNLGFGLTTIEDSPPPADLQGIVSVEGTQILAGFVGNKVYFSQNGEPHNWPKHLELTLDSNIVHMVESNGVIYVSTTDYPYMISGAADCEDRPCREVRKGDYPLPDIACGYAHSAVATPMGMVYASVDGLVLVPANGFPILITEGVLSAEDWKKLNPETARISFYKGQIVCVTDSVSFFLLIDADQFSVTSKTATMSTFSDTPVDMICTGYGELLFLYSSGDIYQWNASEKVRAYEWSTILITDSKHWMTSIRVGVHGDATITLESERGNQYTRVVSTEDPFRVPRLGRSRAQGLRIVGTGEIEYIRLGESNIEESNNG